MGDHDNDNNVPFRLTLRDLPLPVRLVLSLFLLAVGLGYFSALVQLHFQNASPGEPLPTPDDVVEIFSGVENWSGTEAAAAQAWSARWKTHHGAGEPAAQRLRERCHSPSSVRRLRPKRSGPSGKANNWRSRHGLRRPIKSAKEAYNNDAFPLPKSLADQPITTDFVDGSNVKVKSIIEERCGKCHCGRIARR